MLITLDYYRILGVPPGVTEEQLLQAYQDRRLQLPRWEYSEAAIQSRLAILEQAYQILCDPQQRDRYQQTFFGEQTTDRVPSLLVDETPNAGTKERNDDKKSISTDKIVTNTILNDRILTDTTPSNGILTNGIPSNGIPFDKIELDLATETIKATNSPLEIDVSPEQWVGALLILQELGEYEQIIAQVTSILGSDPSAPSNESQIATLPLADIYLTIALAYLEISHEQWHNCQYEAAASATTQGLRWLEPKNLLPIVQSEMRSELHKLRPYRILELISTSQPLSPERQQGIHLLQELLQQRQGIDGVGNDGSGLDTDNFLRFIQQIRSYLTVDEQLTLFEEETQRPSVAARYLRAYALVAQGFAYKQPHHLVSAYQSFENLNFRQDMLLEQSVCALLLGQTDIARAILQQHPNPKILDLLPRELAQESDWLRSSCVVAERWLQNEVFTQFSDLAGKTASLQDYFEDKKVQAYLNQNPISLNSSAYSLSEPEPIMAKPQPESHSDYPTPKQRIRSSRRYRESHHGTGTTPRQTATRQTATLSPPRLPVDQSPGNGSLVSSDRYLVTESYQSPIPETHRYGADQPASSNESVRLNPRRIRRKKSSIKIGRVLLLLAALAGCVGVMGLAVKWLIERQSPLVELQQDQLFIPLHQPVIDIPPANALLSAPETITPEFAQQFIQSWLAVKANALGKDHQLDRLATILLDPQLKTWQNRATALKQSGSYWQYQHSLEANSLKVKTVSPTQANAEAIVREQATYYQGGKAVAKQSYDDTLRVRYGLVRQGDRWLIQSIQVIN